MKKPYFPEKGTAPHKAVEYFSANPHEELGSAQLAKLVCVAPKNISGAMANVVGAGLLSVRRQGRSCYYTLGNGEPMAAAASTAPRREPRTPAATATAAAPVAEPTEVEKITVALYNDGELTITGAREIDGGILLTRAMAADLREYLVHTGSLLEHLQEAR